MSEKDFDKGYKSGFKFGKEVANEEWLDKVKQARIDIIQNLYTEGMFIDRARILGILNRLIEREG